MVEIIGRDVYKFEESRVFPDYFEQGTPCQVKVTGLLLVPGKLLCAVGRPVANVCEVPCMVVAKDSWMHNPVHTDELCGKAVQQRNSAFRDLIGKGDKAKQATVKCSFAPSPFTIYYCGLSEDVTLNFAHEIIY